MHIGSAALVLQVGVAEGPCARTAAGICASPVIRMLDHYICVVLVLAMGALVWAPTSHLQLNFSLAGNPAANGKPSARRRDLAAYLHIGRDLNGFVLQTVWSRLFGLAETSTLGSYRALASLAVGLLPFYIFPKAAGGRSIGM